MFPKTALIFDTSLRRRHLFLFQFFLIFSNSHESSLVCYVSKVCQIILMIKEVTLKVFRHTNNNKGNVSVLLPILCTFIAQPVICLRSLIVFKRKTLFCFWFFTCNQMPGINSVALYIFNMFNSMVTTHMKLKH